MITHAMLLLDITTKTSLKSTNIPLNKQNRITQKSKDTLQTVFLFCMYIRTSHDCRYLWRPEEKHQVPWSCLPCMLGTYVSSLMLRHCSSPAKANIFKVFPKKRIVVNGFRYPVSLRNKLLFPHVSPVVINKVSTSSWRNDWPPGPVWQLTGLPLNSLVFHVQCSSWKEPWFPFSITRGSQKRHRAQCWGYTAALLCPFTTHWSRLFWHYTPEQPLLAKYVQQRKRVQEEHLIKSIFIA